MRRPNLTRNVIGDLMCVAAAAKANSAEAFRALTPRELRACARGIEYLEALAQWHREARQKPAAREAPPS